VPPEEGNSFKVAHSALKCTQNRGCTATSAPAWGQQMSPAANANATGQKKYKVSSRREDNDDISLHISVAAKWTRLATSFLWEQLRMS